ncbi:MAG: hypothetical protein P1U34_04650 [Coxiellaceae bacterium]|nr:hypothetical protein [Coxiellaceae bacterium]
MFAIEGFLILRILLFCKLIYALKSLLADWGETEDMVGLMFPRATGFFAVLMVVVLIASAVSILFGIYGQIGGILLFFFCMLGCRMHMILKNIAADIEMDDSATDENKGKLRDAKALAVMGQSACAQKNVVIGAVGLFFFGVGTGPFSLTGCLF